MQVGALAVGTVILVAFGANPRAARAQCATLAIGAPHDGAGAAGAGAVNVLYGTEAGIRNTGDQIWHQNVTGIDGASEAGEELGYGLASGDFDCDNRDDLAIGAPGNPSGGNPNAGSVNVVYGTSTGLTVTGSQEWTQNSSGVEGAPEVDDRFGESVAALPELTWIFVDDFEGGDATDWSSAFGD